jgi:hypothetical protein
VFIANSQLLTGNPAASFERDQRSNRRDGRSALGPPRCRGPARNRSWLTDDTQTAPPNGEPQGIHRCKFAAFCDASGRGFMSAFATSGLIEVWYADTSLRFERISREIKSVTNGHGGARPRAGRPKGSLNKVTRDVRELALIHGPAAMKELARLSIQAESEAARIAACKEILDRAYRRPPQAAQGDGDECGELQPERTWLDQAKALGLFIAKIEQKRTLEQQGRQPSGTSTGSDRD